GRPTPRLPTSSAPCANQHDPTQPIARPTSGRAAPEEERMEPHPVSERRRTRRHFLLGSVAGLVLLCGCGLSRDRGQPGARRVGLFHVGLDHVPPSLETLYDELRVLGYEEGRDLHLDWRNLPDERAAHDVAHEFVRDGASVIVAFENQTVRAAIAATSEI